MKRWDAEKYKRVAGQAVALPGTDCLSQYGRTYFREQPRWEEITPPETDISMQHGDLTAAEVALIVTRRPPRRGDRVRHFYVSDLEDASYWVRGDPNPAPPRHCSVTAPMTPACTPQCKAWWENSQRVTLESLSHSAATEEAR